MGKTCLTFILLLFRWELYAESSVSLAEKLDSNRAFVHIQKQVQFGARPSGSEELQKTRDYLVSELRSYGLEVQEQIFTQETPRGPIRFVNIRASQPLSWMDSLFKKNKPILILASHYDTKWLPKIHFVGANDGASSTAVLLEIARVVAQEKFQPSNCKIEFVFFDGEEAIEKYSATDGLYGSRYYVKQLKSESKDDKIKNMKAMILMDMIGDRDLSVQIPQGDPDLVARVLDASKALGFRDYFGYKPLPMMDDHFPFFLEGIPCIDMIDFEYGPDHRWWHTGEDSIDKISSKSLEMIGKTLLKILESF